MIKKIRTKIILFYAALTFLIGLLFFMFFIDLIKNIHMAVITREMREKVRMIELLMSREEARDFNDRTALRKTIREISGIINLRITVIDWNGRVVVDSSLDAESMDNHLYRREIQEAITGGEGKSVRYSNSTKKNMLYYAEKSGRYIFRLSKDIDEIDRSVLTVRRGVLIFSGVLLLCAMIINLVVSKIITGPINSAVSFAEDFARGNLGRRIFNYSDDEIGVLQKSLNRLADSLQDKVNRLTYEQSRLLVIIESIHDGLAVIGNERRLILLNRAFRSLLSIETQAEGRFYYEVIRSSELNSRIEQALSGGEPLRFEEELLGGRHCEVYINPIRDDGTTQGILIVLHDITEPKKMSQMKTDLVGNLSHELKTPITILKGYLETISARAGDPEEIRGFIEKALVSVDRQNSIINDMLKLNMLETSNYFQPEEINLGEIIENCAGLLQPKITEKRITLSMELDALPAGMRANRFLVEEIFFNLIDNAINYNKYDGCIRIISESDSGRLRVSIADSGIGIPPDLIDRIFERFFRVSKSRSRATGGTGLGLSIVKHAAELLQWEISVSSSGEGSIFTVGIPQHAMV